jgi:hypothetical protein
MAIMQESKVILDNFTAHKICICDDNDDDTDNYDSDDNDDDTDNYDSDDNDDDDDDKGNDDDDDDDNNKCNGCV